MELCPSCGNDPLDGAGIGRQVVRWFGSVPFDGLEGPRVTFLGGERVTEDVELVEFLLNSQE